jgi:drug/metabolite transporter (DMT)-like permease
LVSICSTAYALLFEEWHVEPLLNAAPAILYSGFFSIGAAFTLQAYAQVHTPASDAAIIMSTESIFAALFGFLLLGEILNQRELFGCALVLTGVVISQLNWQTRVK